MPALTQYLGKYGVTDTLLSYSIDSLSSFSGSSPTSGANPTGNTAIFIPFRLWVPFHAVKMFVLNGTTMTGTNHIDLGIYSLTGNRLASTGSTVQTGTSVVQAIALSSPVLLMPGTYYMAMCMDNGTDHVFRKSVNNSLERGLGMLKQTSAFPLPSTMTPVAVTSAFYPLIGISDQSVV